MISPKLLVLLGMSACTALTASAQSIGPSAITAAGNSTATSSLTHEYAVGQVVVSNTFSSTALVVTPGVLQPVIAASNSITPQSLTLAEMNVFPNPVESDLFMQPGFTGAGMLSYSLYDAAGKLVMMREVALTSGVERQSILMTPFAAGQYSLQVAWRQGATTALGAYKVQKLR